MEIKDRFDQQKDSFALKVIIDQETGIEYLQEARANDVALIALLNRDGLPKKATSNIQAVSSKKDKRFEKRTGGFLSGFSVIIDRETGLEYLSSTSGEGTALTVLLTADGAPKVNKDYQKMI